MTPPDIPDRSTEPALQDSLDHGPRATTATNSDEDAQAQGASPKDAPLIDEQETPRVDKPYPDEASPAPVKEPPSDEEVEEATGVPAESQELSTI